MAVRNPTTGTAQFYRDRADAALGEADSATLSNVRERCLRSAAVWQQLAERAERVSIERAARESASGREVH